MNAIYFQCRQRNSLPSYMSAILEYHKSEELCKIAFRRNANQVSPINMENGLTE